MTKTFKKTYDKYILVHMHNIRLNCSIEEPDHILQSKTVLFPTKLYIIVSSHITCWVLIQNL